MSKRHSDHAKRTRNDPPNNSTRRPRRSRAASIAALVTAGFAFASSCGIVVYPFVVTHSILDLVTPWWLALLPSLGFFVFFLQHAQEELRQNSRRMRDGIAVVILAVGWWCVLCGKRIRMENSAGLRWLAVPGLAIMAFLISRDTPFPILAAFPDTPRQTEQFIQLQVPAVPAEPWILLPGISVSLRGTWPAIASSHHKLIAKRASRLKQIARRAPFNIAPTAPPPVGYRIFPPFNPICLIPFIAWMTPQELSACGLGPWPISTERQSSEGAIH